MARPLIKKEEKRSVRFTFRMTEREIKYLSKLCEYTNLSAAEVIRETLFKNRVLRPRIPVLDQKSYTELKRIGSNINQIARHLNSGGHLASYQALGELNTKLTQVLKTLLK